MPDFFFTIFLGVYATRKTLVKIYTHPHNQPLFRKLINGFDIYKEKQYIVYNCQTLRWKIFPCLCGSDDGFAITFYIKCTMALCLRMR